VTGFWRRALGSPGTPPGELLRQKYVGFRRLLATNNEILELIAELEGALAAGRSLPHEELRGISSAVHARARLMVEDLGVIADGRYGSLRGNVERIAAGVEEALRTVQGTPVTAACLPLDRLDRTMADVVGGKAANLGEVRNVVGLPVPPGFAVSAFAYRSFVAGAGIQGRLTELWNSIEWDDLASVSAAATAMQAVVLAAEIPQDVREAITLAAHDLYRQAPGHPRVAIRSSAIGEDSRASFAGQYSSYLNVPLEQVLRRYRETVASKFGARALFYMHSRGFHEEEIAMSVGCFLMVEARAAGVAYSLDPNDADLERMTIAAVWGLGKPVVDGTITPDVYRVPRTAARGGIEAQVARKLRRVEAAPGGGVVEVDVPPDLQTAPCMEEAHLERLADYLRTLESHFRCPQDVEWVLDNDGRLLVLQTRPLRLSARPTGARAGAPDGAKHPILLAGGATACPGAGAGPVVHADTDEELSAFPPGGVLVARQNSPRFVKVMTRAAAIVTEVGSVTGHMASLTREYGVPTICDARSATSLPAGLEVTVDASSCRVLRGRVEQLLLEAHPRTLAQRDLPSLAVQERVTSRIAHLNLTDPARNSFRAKNCTTYHDVVRFCHEMAISEMFHINDYSNLRDRGMAFRLDTEVPLGIYLIDLGDGVAAPPGATSVRPDAITSVPMRALWRGITTPGARWSGARPVDVGGFLSVVASTVADRDQGARALGESSYAMVGSHYVNFGSRLGYHFTTLEAVCSDNVHENYITFRFKGGAADIRRRERRVRFIAEVLRRHRFETDQRQDLLNAWVRKLPRRDVETRLEMLGRLMACARQLDVVMHAETTVGGCVDAFLADRFEFFDFEKADRDLGIQ
jgi:pyruvate,water dikinase